MGIFKDFNNNWIDSQNGVLCLRNFPKSRQRKRTCVDASPGIFGRGGRNRTFYLQVMSLTSYQCSTPLYLDICNLARF